MMKDIFIEGNIAVVTGAADGIGLAATLKFAQQGLTVCMIDNNQEKLDQAKKTLGSKTIQTYSADVSNISQLEDIHKEILSEHGKINVLMNNAGISRPTKDWSELENWRKVIDVNLWGVINGVQTFVPTMLEFNEPGIVINTGSKQGITTPPGNPAYNVAKAGVKALTESLQHSFRNFPNCKLSAHLLVPGFTYTGIMKKFRPEKPDAAWLPEQVIDYMMEKLSNDSFYIICPDNDVTEEMDQKRIEWAAQDIIQDRPALSRWHKDFKDSFESHMNTQTG